MKPSILAFCMFACLTMPLAAQREGMQRRPAIGPYAALNLAMNTADYHVSGAERSIVPGSHFGVVSDIPIGKQTSLLAALGYYTLAFKDVNEKLDPGGDNPTDISLPSKLTTEGSFNYIALLAMFKIDYFCVGFQFGLPVAATIENSMEGGLRGSGDSRFRADISPESSERAFLIEVRLGGDFPVVDLQDGSINLTFTGGYPLTEHLSEAENALPKMDDNFRMPNLSLGLSYRFGL